MYGRSPMNIYNIFPSIQQNTIGKGETNHESEKVKKGNVKRTRGMDFRF